MINSTTVPLAAIASFVVACRTSTPHQELPRKTGPANSASEQGPETPEHSSPAIPETSLVVDGVVYDSIETLGVVEAKKRRVSANSAPARMALISTVMHDEHAPCLLGPEGRTALVPPLDIHCAQGPDRTCLPVDDPKEPWEYAGSLWDTPEWNHIGFRLDLPTYYHYGFSWHGTSSFDCTYRIEAYGDLDDDGIFSTFVLQRPLPDGWNGRPPNPTALE